MDENMLSSIEMDAIGEILNISLGAASTAVSTMLDARVDITTPIVKIRDKQEFEFKNLEPAICVEIANEVGLTGSNVMILKRSDVCAIVGMLMGMEISEEDFVLDEITTSAVGEVMNQMMGASATALSELLDKTVDISPPIIFPLDDADQFKDKYFTDHETNTMVQISFYLQIADKVNSEFLYLIPIDLARELTSGFFGEGMPEEDTLLSQPATPEPTPQVEPTPPPVVPEPAVVVQAPEPPVAPPPVASAPPIAPPPAYDPAVQAAYAQPLTYQPMFAPAQPDVTQKLEQMMELMQKQMEMTQMQFNQLQSQPKKIKVNPPSRPNLKQEFVEDAFASNLDMVMGVPVEVSVEIGRTRKLVKDVLDLNKGSLVVLDKLAGEQVDLFVNGQCIAHGDVVVIDDNFGIRITEILSHDLNLTE